MAECINPKEHKVKLHNINVLWLLCFVRAHCALHYVPLRQLVSCSMLLKLDV